MAQPTNDVRISLIICTRNRAESLGRCLSAVQALVWDEPWELVVVDNNSSDRTADVIKEFARRADFPVRYVHETAAGLSNARNAGVAASTGAIVALTDDDCYPRPDFLARVAKAFEDPEIGFVTGRILLHDPTDYPATINESVEPLRFKRGRFLPAGAIKGANLHFRRGALEAAGGFDPAFGSGALFPSEDVDTAARVCRSGWDGVYDPAIVVSHHHGRKASDVGSLLKSYDIGRGAYHLKLLLHDRAVGHAWRGWRGLPRRMVHRPASLRWELAGALGYLKVWRRGRNR